jgi:hypothetical protein
MDSTTAKPPGGRREQETGTAPRSDAGPYKESAMSLTDYPNSTAAQMISSSQVDWWTVRQYFLRLAEGLGIKEYPAAGTPAWSALNDNDPTKLIAALDYAQHHALRVDTAQEARCAASRDVSQALDWPRAAKWLQDSAEWYAANPWMRRTR